MLTALRIQNLALVEDLTWEPGAGLIAVTGETGAGKSIIVGAVKLVLGERADRSLIRTGSESCLIDALFSLASPEEIDLVLTQAGFEPCADGELHVRRTISSQGANRQFVNGTPIPLAVLKEIGDRLVDLHGAHDHHSLMSRDRQLALLDKFGLSESTRTAYQEAHRLWSEAKKVRLEFENDVQLSETERELLRHQAEEIESARLTPGEDVTLRKKFTAVSQQRRFFDLSAAMKRLLTDEPGGLQSQLHAAQKVASDLERIDPELAPVLESIARARAELDELEAGLDDRGRELDLDPQQAAELEDRLNLIESLRRKYGGDVEEILERGQNALRRLSAAENRQEEGEKLRAAEESRRNELETHAKAVRKQREKAAPALAAAVESHLRDLGFQRAVFEISLQPLEEPGFSGADAVDFLFSPNPGEPPKPLRLIASSGEMARVMLAVKCALAQEDTIPLLIFDEIDANVGGAIAASVGDKMRTLANGQQVVAITHLPQVAARGDSHFLVTKDFSDGRTRSTLHEISGEARIDEIARMLGGSRESAIHHAVSLIEDGALHTRSAPAPAEPEPKTTPRKSSGKNARPEPVSTRKRP